MSLHAQALPYLGAPRTSASTEIVQTHTRFRRAQPYIIETISFF